MAYDTDPGDLPDRFSTSGFDWDTGLGTIGISFNASGAYSFCAFFDHEIVQVGNTYFDEYGEVQGIAVSGQS